MNSDDEIKYCVYCGKKIPYIAKKCSYCQKTLVNERSYSTNYDYNNYNIEESYEIAEDSQKIKKNNDLNKIDTEPTNSENQSLKNHEYSKAIPIRRLYLLIIFTGGLYGIYWFYKTNSYLKNDLHKNIHVKIRTFFFIIPIANIIVFYQLLNDMNKYIESEGIESYSPSLNTLIWYFIPFFGMWVLINLQESINEFWRIKEPNLLIRRNFSNGEIAIMFLGVIFIALIFLLYIMILVFITSNTYI